MSEVNKTNTDRSEDLFKEDSDDIIQPTTMDASQLFKVTRSCEKDHIIHEIVFVTKKENKINKTYEEIHFGLNLYEVSLKKWACSVQKDHTILYLYFNDYGVKIYDPEFTHNKILNFILKKSAKSKFSHVACEHIEFISTNQIPSIL